MDRGGEEGMGRGWMEEVRGWMEEVRRGWEGGDGESEKDKSLITTHYTLVSHSAYP